MLYIDPETYRLVGYQYANGYQPLLDIMNIDISQPFEYEKAARPDDAIVFDGPLKTTK